MSERFPRTIATEDVRDWESEGGVVAGAEVRRLCGVCRGDLPDGDGRMRGASLAYRPCPVDFGRGWMVLGDVTECDVTGAKVL